MLIRFDQFSFSNDSLSIPHVGEVVSNSDPKKLGRIKVKITGLLEGDTSLLPWCYPENTFQVAGGGGLSFSVPEVGTKVIVEFPYEDIYMPRYTGINVDDISKSSYFDSNYPNSYGWIDSQGNKFKINKTTGDFEFIHKSGSGFTIKNNGDVELNSTAKAKFSGSSGTEVGNSGSVTDVKGSMVNLAGGGKAIATIGSQALGYDSHGVPVISDIIDGSSGATAP